MAQSCEAEKHIRENRVGWLRTSQRSSKKRTVTSKTYVAETENGHDALDGLDAESPHAQLRKEHFERVARIVTPLLDDTDVSDTRTLHGEMSSFVGGSTYRSCGIVVEVFDIVERGVERSQVRRRVSITSTNRSANRWNDFRKRAVGLSRAEKRAMYHSGKTSDEDIQSALRRKRDEQETKDTVSVRNIESGQSCQCDTLIVEIARYEKVNPWNEFQKRSVGLSRAEKQAMYKSGKTSDQDIQSALRKKKEEEARKNDTALVPDSVIVDEMTEELCRASARRRKAVERILNRDTNYLASTSIILLMLRA